MKKILFLASLSVLICSCSDIIGDYAMPRLVVESYIDNDSAPKVYLTKSIDVFEEYRHFVTIQQEYVVKDASVSVNGIPLEQEDSSDGYLRSCYTSNSLKGAINQDYELRIVYGNNEYLGHTSIICNPPVVSVAKHCIPGSEGKYRLDVTIKPIGQGQYGRIFVKVNSLVGQEYLLAPNTGFTYMDFDSSDSIVLSVLRPTTDYLEIEDEYFSAGETVEFKVSLMDSIGYYVWNDFEKHSDLSRNPMFPVNGNMTGTVNNALGYWIGYASAFFKLDI